MDYMYLYSAIFNIPMFIGTRCIRSKMVGRQLIQSSTESLTVETFIETHSVARTRQCFAQSFPYIPIPYRDTVRMNLRKYHIHGTSQKLNHGRSWRLRNGRNPDASSQKRHRQLQMAQTCIQLGGAPVEGRAGQFKICIKHE